MERELRIRFLDLRIPAFCQSTLSVDYKILFYVLDTET